MTRRNLKAFDSLASLPRGIKEGKVNVSVLGLGRIGLPIAVVLAKTGLKIVGIERNEKVVRTIRRGFTPFHYPIIQEWMNETQRKGLFSVTNDIQAAIKGSNLVLVCVGTPIGPMGQLDYSQLYSALNAIARSRSGDLAIMLRSTSAPGTMERIVKPMFSEQLSKRQRGRVVLSVCPERILEGRAHTELYELPEIVAADDDLGFEIARALFRRINPNKHILRTTPTGAELAKLFTNIYRYVGFAIANEFAIWSEQYGVDASEVIAVANQGYARSRIPQPGFAGGPCLGKDGFLLDNGTTFSSIVSVAWKLNEAIPHHVATSIMKVTGSLYGKKVAVLGASFKAESDDTRMSPSLKLADTLTAYGAQVIIHDPYVQGTSSLSAALRDPEIVVVATNHAVFRGLAKRIDASGCRLVYDVWKMYDPKSFSRSRYLSLGGILDPSTG